MRSTDTTVALLPVDVAAPRAETPAARLATIVSLTADGAPLVRLRPDADPVPALLGASATRARIERAIAERQQVLVLLADGNPATPVLVGFIEPAAADPEGSSAPDAPGRAAASTADSPSSPVIEADVDGRRVRVTARDEIVLQCGSASVTLRRNGRVVIRGAYVETHAHGTNRIRGGQVQIN